VALTSYLCHGEKFNFSISAAPSTDNQESSHFKDGHTPIVKTALK